MKNIDVSVLEKALELQRVASADYNAIYNELTGTSSSQTVSSILFDELRIAENVRKMLSVRIAVNSEKSADTREIKETVDEIKNDLY